MPKMFDRILNRASRTESNERLELDPAELDAANLVLKGIPPRQIVRWALAKAKRPMLPTSFGSHAAALLNLVVQEQPDIPVVWIDHGFNTDETYRFAQELIERLDLNMHIYAPKHSPAWISATLGGVPDIDEPAHAEFTQQVKLEPFERALAELQPDVWLTGIRADETELRRGLGTLSRDARGPLKVAPLLDWQASEVEAYLAEHDLPSEPKYFDPTKGIEGRECGLHQPEPLSSSAA